MGRIGLRRELVGEVKMRRWCCGELPETFYSLIFEKGVYYKRK
jgi:hypothetical protein